MDIFVKIHAHEFNLDFIMILKNIIKMHIHYELKLDGITENEAVISF